MSLEKLSSSHCFGGEQLRFKHKADTTACTMHFSVYLPPQAKHKPVPVLLWLSGLTCTDENFVTKAGAQRYAAARGLALVTPDTSPRGDDVPDDPEGAYDFGLGAGFYVNATQNPWRRHYRMYDYIVTELPEVLSSISGLDLERVSISGHSMGGHGALTLGLRNPTRYRSISAFSPICSASESPWGIKALSLYLGDNRDTWLDYDACALLRRAKHHVPILVDQGGADDFLKEQLTPDRLMRASHEANYPISLRLHAGYDHSYFFIASLIGEHMTFHAGHLSV